MGIAIVKHLAVCWGLCLVIKSLTVSVPKVNNIPSSPHAHHGNGILLRLSSVGKIQSAMLKFLAKRSHYPK